MCVCVCVCVHTPLRVHYLCEQRSCLHGPILWRLEDGVNKRRHLLVCEAVPRVGVLHIQAQRQQQRLLTRRQRFGPASCERVREEVKG